MRFERDDAEAAADLREHWAGCDGAAEVFYDPTSVSDAEVGHSRDEARFFIVGYSSKPDVYKVRRGGFLARHPELKDKLRKRP